MENLGHHTQIYAVADTSPAALARVPGLLAGVPVAALLIRASNEDQINGQIAAELIGIAQGASVAALLAEDPALAVQLKADGVHLSWTADCESRFKAAREILGPQAIVGAGAGKSRHDAMALGEAGADYIAFGVPGHVKDRAAGRIRRDELVGWWGEIFETPCVAFDVEDVQETLDLAHAGADFVGLTIPAGLSLADTVDFFRSHSAALSSGEAVQKGA